jgi:hypothetical protein
LIKDTVLKVKPPLNLILLSLNMFIPGLGTMISSIVGAENGKINRFTFTIGLL